MIRHRHIVSAVCYVLVLLVALSALHWAGFIRFPLLFILAAVAYFSSALTHRLNTK